ncbi:MAG: hypothetical protein MAG795_01022 [Candidatus Woesearchaeota archaeon]|nr:hypothetical protein [Candidatus Woesearchaeota archaeon]
MEKFQAARNKASKRLKIADHMMVMTYPLVKDSKLLLAVLENLFLALTNSVASVLYYERLFKRIPPFHDTFESKFNRFRSKIVPKYNIDMKYVKMIKEIKDIIVMHKKSPVEFTRKDKFVIASKNYKIKTISVEQIKEYIKDTKSFVAQMEEIVSKNEQIFK